MFRESVEADYRPSNAGTAETDFKLTVAGSFKSSVPVRYAATFHIAVVPANVAPQEEAGFKSVKEEFRALADRLCEEHPAISTERHIFGGIPHIKGVRLSVGDILAKLYTYGNIQEILETYGPHVSEEQVKEAIAYAQDFLEIACDPDEASEIDD